MNWMKAVMLEAYGLFVDDGWFAAAILGWVATVAAALRRVDRWWVGVVLAAGLIGILTLSAVRFAKRGR